MDILAKPFLAILGFMGLPIFEYMLVGCLLLAGLYFTIRLKFIQIFQFTEFFRSTFPKKQKKSLNQQGITPFQALSVSLAARVGTGNVTGVALALYTGGPGAIFWMWIVAFLGIATAYAESLLGQLYKVRNDEGKFRGGPAFYISKGLNAPWAAAIFAVFLIICYGFAFNAVQANSIAEANYYAFGIPKVVTGVIVMIVAGIVILGGIRKIAQVAEYTVPFMAIAYLLVALYVIFTHLPQVPHAFYLIVSNAFGFEQVQGGFMGGMLAAMLSGVNRGLFANEAGMGSTPNIAAVADPTPNHPATQGFVQALGALLDIVVVCTASAILILLSGELNYGSQVTGMELTQKAMYSYFGGFGPIFIAVIITFFAFTSIIGNYSYAENGLIYLRLGSKKALRIFAVLLLVVVLLGALQQLTSVFDTADIFMRFMALINIIGIVLLSGHVIKVTKDYLDQKKAGKEPTFNVDNYPELEGQLDPSVWQKAKGSK